MRMNSRARHLKSAYGMTEEHYWELFKKQGGVCAACGEPAGMWHARHKNLSVDHVHVTGEIRGLLCHQCNVSIGYALDSPERLDGMKNYLLQWRNHG